MKQVFKCVYLLVFLSLTGCSWLNYLNPFAAEKDADASNIQVVEPTENAAEVISVPENVQPSSTNEIEILWRVPVEPVDNYYVNYGENEADLSDEIKISVVNLTKIDHPKFGRVYRYELKNVPADKVIFISLRAENSGGVSKPSAPTRIEPGQTTVTP